MQQVLRCQILKIFKFVTDVTLTGGQFTFGKHQSPVRMVALAAIGVFGKHGLAL